VALLGRLLGARDPVSRVVGVSSEKAVFCFNEGGKPLHYCRELDTLLCMEVGGRKLKLFDVVAPKLPRLGEILERMPRAIEKVEMNFAADRLAPNAEAVKRVFDHDGPSYLMARGAFDPEGEAFTLPRPART
jgi:hypothetical protein